MTGPQQTFAAANTLMVQGTTSDAGKSAVITALCRILARRGLSVAPFKPQNMALNSAVTPDGGEIGRAQAVQAMAAGIEPRIDFNPVLLKPNSDSGAQIIVDGHAAATLDASDYHGFKPRLLESVRAAHQRLAEAFDVVLVEGAGSPAEINLRENDIANMGFAEAADCPVVLVADIERGGVFAHLYGTVALLSASERSRVVGFVINRFRGDQSLLQSGLDWLEAQTGIPVIAVLPYVDNLHLEAEDSLSQGSDDAGGSRMDIVVPRLPRLSNSSDFDPLRLHPDVHFRYTRQPPGRADLIILPGSKNVRQDLTWLTDQGWGSAIQRHLRYGGHVIGICGGYQMLGRVIDDPDGVEGPPGRTDGLGLFALHTTLQQTKQLRQVSGTCRLTQTPVTGYEIHAGESHFEGSLCPAPLLDLDNRSDGASDADGQIAGTYVHGLFDQPDTLAGLLEWAGLTQPDNFDYTQYRLAEIDRLADHVESAWPPEAFLSLLGAPPQAGNVEQP